MSREHRQAYMEGFGRAMLMDDYREQTAELSQEFAEFGGLSKPTLRRQRAEFMDEYRALQTELRHATDKYHAELTSKALKVVRRVGNKRNRVWKKIMKIQDQLGNKGLPFVAPVEDPWWNQ